MKNAILDYIRQRPTTTFANLDRDIPGFTGNHAMFQEAFPNVILWPFISEEAIDALSELLHEGTIIMEKASPISYFVDQKLPTMKSASGFKLYKTPRWLPVCFSTPADVEARSPKKKTPKRTSRDAKNA